MGVPDVLGALGAADVLGAADAPGSASATRSSLAFNRLISVAMASVLVPSSMSRGACNSLAFCAPAPEFVFDATTTVSALFTSFCTAATPVWSVAISCGGGDVSVAAGLSAAPAASAGAGTSVVFE